MHTMHSRFLISVTLVIACVSQPSSLDDPPRLFTVPGFGGPMEYKHTKAQFAGYAKIRSSSPVQTILDPKKFETSLKEWTAFAGVDASILYGFRATVGVKAIYSSTDKRVNISSEGSAFFVAPNLLVSAHHTVVPCRYRESPSHSAYATTKEMCSRDKVFYDLERNQPTRFREQIDRRAQNLKLYFSLTQVLVNTETVYFSVGSAQISAEVVARSNTGETYKWVGPDDFVLLKTPTYRHEYFLKPHDCVLGDGVVGIGYPMQVELNVPLVPVMKDPTSNHPDDAYIDSSILARTFQQDLWEVEMKVLSVGLLEKNVHTSGVSKGVTAMFLYGMSGGPVVLARDGEKVCGHILGWNVGVPAAHDEVDDVFYSTTHPFWATVKTEIAVEAAKEEANTAKAAEAAKDEV